MEDPDQDLGGSGAQHSKRRRKQNLRKKSPFAAKKKIPIIVLISALSPPPWRSGRGGEGSISFIAVEERTRKMLTAFMHCGINNNRLWLYGVL